MQPRPPRNASRAGTVADIILAAGAVPWLAILGAALVALPAALRTDQLIVFYVVPALVLATLAGLLRRAREPTRVNLATLCFTLGVTLFGAEAFLTWGPPSRAGRAVPWIAPADRDPRRLDEIVLSRRATAPRTFPRVTAPMVLGRVFHAGGRAIRPVSPGISDADLVLCNDVGHPVSYHGDRFGFNNPPDAWRDSTVDVVVLGDSYAQGLCQDVPLQWATLLRAQLPRLRNLGVSGSGPLAELAVLREFGRLGRPRLVLWVFYEANDLYDLRREVQDTVLMHYLRDPAYSQGLAARQTETDAVFAPWLDSLMARAPEAISEGEAARRRRTTTWRDALQLSAIRRLLGVYVEFPGRTEALGMLPAVLARARDDVAAWGGRFEVVYMPLYARYRTSVGDAAPQRRAVLAMLDSLRIRVIDLHPAFAAEPKPTALWDHPDAHLSAAGNVVVSEAVLRALAPREKPGSILRQ